MLPDQLAFPFDKYPRLLEKLKDPMYKSLFVYWLNEFDYIFSNGNSLPLCLQKRLPKMKIAVEELKRYHGIN
jgi:hypothetical protein